MTMNRTSFRGVAVIMLIAVAALFGALMSSPATAAVGGPVLLDGGDFPDHGSKSGSDTNPNINGGWQYAMAAIQNLAPSVTRPNDGSVALLGSSDSTSSFSQTGGNYHWVGVKLGKTITYHNGAAAINQFFVDLVVSPRSVGV